MPIDYSNLSSTSVSYMLHFINHQCYISHLTIDRCVCIYVCPTWIIPVVIVQSHTGKWWNNGSLYHIKLNCYCVIATLCGLQNCNVPCHNGMPTLCFLQNCNVHWYMHICRANHIHAYMHDTCNNQIKIYWLYFCHLYNNISWDIIHIFFNIGTKHIFHRSDCTPILFQFWHI